MSRTVVIVIHVYRPTLSDGERISLLQLKKMLGNYPVALVCPNNLDISSYREILGSTVTRVCHFHKDHFTGLRGYNKLLLSRKFYSTFLEYDYMLLHHTDAFVFSNDMEYWLEQDYDNIGAPIYAYDGTLNPRQFIATGNGGFSLRKVRPFYEIAGSYRSVYRFADVLENFRLYNWKGRIARAPYYASMLLTLGSRMHSRMNYIRVNEDVIWSYYVPKHFPGFRNAPFAEGLKFSMEFNCDRLLAMNNNKLPFGCHGWFKPLFIDFWRPHVETFGYNIK